MGRILNNSLIFCFIFAALTGCHQGNTNNKKSESLEKITAVLQCRLDSLTINHVVPGITLSVRLGESSNITIASGFADIENRIPMKPDAFMLSGSVGKTYVAAVTLKLQEMRLIDVRAKAFEYLGDCMWFREVPNFDKITVEMLLNHTAGVPEYAYKKELWELLAKNPDKEWQVGEQLSYIINDLPSNAPGEAWNYSDSHYLIVGAIIEKVTGKKYYDLLNEMILIPCSLQNTFPSDSRSLPGLIPGYTSLYEDLMLPHKVLNDGRYAFNPQMEWTGGGLLSSVSDLSSWARQLYGGDVLSKESRRMMLAPVSASTTLFENANYGLGCFIGETNGVIYYGHTGFAPGYITFVQYIPEYDVAIAIQFNDDSSHNDLSMKNFFNSLKNEVIDFRKGK